MPSQSSEDLLAGLRAAASPVTARTYAKRLASACQAAGIADVAELLAPGGKDSAERVRKTYAAIQKAYPNVTTRKNILTAVLGVWKANPEFKARNAAAHGAWADLHRNLNRLETAARDDNRLSRATSQNVPRLADLKRATAAMERGDPHKTLRDSQAYVLLVLLHDMPPKRRDHGATRVLRSPPRGQNRNEGNYIVLPERGEATLVMNEYKTRHLYGRHVEEVPPTVAAAVRESLARHPRRWLFVGRDGGVMSDHAFGQFVNTVVRDRTGKSGGVNVLRHVWITERCNPAEVPRGELKDIARRMNHSIALQGEYFYVRTP